MSEHYIIQCKCGKKLDITNFYGLSANNTIINVDRHICSYPVLDVEEYYKDEGDMDDNQTQIIYCNILLCYVHSVAHIRCAM